MWPVVLLVLGKAWSVTSLPTGAPTCESRPPHGRERTDPSPYRMEFDVPCYTAATRSVQITLSGPRFNGFVVEAPAGEFGGGGDDWRPNCGRFSITHAHHLAKTLVEALWTPPKNSREPMAFSATVFRSQVDGARTGVGEFWHQATKATLFHCERQGATWQTIRPEPFVPTTPRPRRRLTTAPPAPVVFWTLGPADRWTRQSLPRDFARAAATSPSPTWRFWRGTTTAAPPSDHWRRTAKLPEHPGCKKESDGHFGCEDFVKARPERCTRADSYEASFCRQSCCNAGHKQRPANVLPFPDEDGGPSPLQTFADPSVSAQRDVERAPSLSAALRSEAGCSGVADASPSCPKWVSARPASCTKASDSYEARFCKASCCRLLRKSDQDNQLQFGSTSCSGLRDAEWECGDWAKAADRPCSDPLSFESLRCRRSCCLHKLSVTQPQRGWESQVPVSRRLSEPQAVAFTGPSSCIRHRDVQDGCEGWVARRKASCDRASSYVAQFCKRSCCLHGGFNATLPYSAPVSRREESPSAGAFAASGDGKIRTVGLDSCAKEQDESEGCIGWVSLNPSNCRIPTAFEAKNCMRSCCLVAKGSMPLEPMKYGASVGLSKAVPAQSSAKASLSRRLPVLSLRCSGEADRAPDCAAWLRNFSHECASRDSWVKINCAKSCCGRGRAAKPKLREANAVVVRRSQPRDACQAAGKKDSEALCGEWVERFPSHCRRQLSYEARHCKLSCCRLPGSGGKKKRL